MGFNTAAIGNSGTIAC